MSEQKTIIVKPDQGRRYSMGRISAIFKADGDETDSRYSISEWWLEPHTSGPGKQANPDDHLFYIIEGSLHLEVNGEWYQAERGTYALIPSGAYHDFENREDVRCGFMRLNVPGGLETKMPGMVEHLRSAPRNINHLGS